MAKKKKTKPSLLSRIFRFTSKKKVEVEDQEEVIQPEGFERELEKARKKFQAFHLAKQLKIGEQIVRKDYKIKKNAPDVYRLEGKNYQITIITGNSLYEKDGMMMGVLNLSDAEVSRAIQREHSDLESFLQLWNPALPQNHSNWKQILDWEIFWQQQVILHLRPDSTALLLVSLDQDFLDFYLKHSTRKQKKILHDEIFYLNQGKNSEDWNPHTKNKSLLYPDKALLELNQVIEQCKSKMK